MNKLITILLILFSFGCTKDKQESSITSANIVKLKDSKITKTTTITDNVLTISDELYTLQFKIEKTKINQHNLVLDMKLHKGAHFISPFEKKHFSGKFFMDLGSYKDISFDGDIIETPKAVSRYDGFENIEVIWVHENTTYIQPLKVLSNDDFKVFGRVQFTIELRCSLEQIPFAISYKDGEFMFIDSKC